MNYQPNQANTLENGV